VGIGVIVSTIAGAHFGVMIDTRRRRCGYAVLQHRYPVVIFKVIGNAHTCH